MLHVQVAEHFRENARNDQAVFQCITGPGRRLRAVGDDPPATIRRARQIDRILVQPDTAGRLDALTGPQIAVLAIDQRWRQQAFGKQLLLAVEVGQNGIEQGCPLRDRSRDFGPLFCRDDQRQRVERPRPVGAAGIGVDVVGDPVFLDPSIDEIKATMHFVRRDRVKMNEELPPVRTNSAVGIEHFIVAASAVGVDCEECAGHSASQAMRAGRFRPFFVRPESRNPHLEGLGTAQV